MAGGAPGGGGGGVGGVAGGALAADLRGRGRSFVGGAVGHWREISTYLANYEKLSPT